jgi:hypothetical protein
MRSSAAAGSRRACRSTLVDFGLEPMPPPEFLYHGTAARFSASIR